MYGLIKVRDDLYDIARRIKEVDDRYELYYNARLDRYEIHADGALQIAVPFKRPDARTVELLRRTRVENVGLLLEEIERENTRLAAIEENEKRDKLAALVEEAL